MPKVMKITTDEELRALFSETIDERLYWARKSGNMELLADTKKYEAEDRRREEETRRYLEEKARRARQNEG